MYPTLSVCMHLYTEIVFPDSHMSPDSFVLLLYIWKGPDRPNMLKLGSRRESNEFVPALSDTFIICYNLIIFCDQMVNESLFILLITPGSEECLGIWQA